MCLHKIIYTLYFHVSHEAFNKPYPLKYISDHHFSPSFNAQTGTISKR